MGPTYFQDNKDHSVITRVAEEDGRLTAYTFSTAFQLNQYAEEYKLLNRKISEADLDKLKKDAEELPGDWDPMDYLRTDAKARIEEEKLAATEKAAEESKKEKEKAEALEEYLKEAMKKGDAFWKAMNEKVRILYRLTAGLLSAGIIVAIIWVIKTISG